MRRPHGACGGSRSSPAAAFFLVAAAICAQFATGACSFWPRSIWCKRPTRSVSEWYVGIWLRGAWRGVGSAKRRRPSGLADQKLRLFLSRALIVIASESIKL